MAPHPSHDPLDVEVERVVRVLRNVPARVGEAEVRARLVGFFVAVAPRDVATLDATLRRLPLSAAGSVVAAVVHERPRPTAAPGGNGAAVPAETSEPVSVETSRSDSIALTDQGVLSDDEWAARVASLRRILTST